MTSEIVRPRRLATYLAVFTTGFLTLGIEMVGGRILSPFYGSSIHQWAALIGVALLSYTLGYLFHAPLNRRGTWLPLTAAAAYTLLLPLWIITALEALIDLPLLPGSLAASALSVAPQSILWASLTPHLQQRVGEHESAAILATSTVGSFVGALGVAFYLIPELGLSKCLIALGVLGLMPTLLESGRLRNVSAIALVVVAYPAIVAVIAATPVRVFASTLKRFEVLDSTLRYSRELALIEAKETPYQSYSLWRTVGPEDPTLLFCMNGFVQFEWKEHRRGPRGADYFELALEGYRRLSNPAEGRSFFVGLGGGLVPYLLKEQYPQASVTAVELDPDVADVVLRQLPLSRSMPGPHPPVVHTGDARTYLRRHPQTYDYVFLDAYVGLYIPHHLITREFFALLAERLETDGVLVINVLALLDVDGFQNRLEATLRTVFPVTATLDVSYSANRVVYAFKSADRARAAVARAAGVPGESAELFRDAVAAAAAHPAPPVTPGARIFTDDRNDIDSILYKAQEHVYRFKKMF